MLVREPLGLQWLPVVAVEAVVEAVVVVVADKDLEPSLLLPRVPVPPTRSTTSPDSLSSLLLLLLLLLVCNPLTFRVIVSP